MKDIPALNFIIIITGTKFILAKDDLERTNVLPEEEYKNKEIQQTLQQIFQQLKKNIRPEKKAESTYIEDMKNDESLETEINGAFAESDEKYAYLSHGEPENNNESILSKSVEMENLREIFNDDSSEENSHFSIEPVGIPELINFDQKQVFENKSPEDKLGFVEAEDQLDKFIRIAAKKIMNVPNIDIAPQSSPIPYLNVGERNEYPLQIGNMYPIDKAPLLQQNFRSLYNSALYKPATYSATRGSGLNYSPNPYRAVSSLEQFSSDRNSYSYSPPASSFQPLYPVNPYSRNQNIFQQRENLPNYFGMDQSQMKPSSTLDQEMLTGNAKVVPIPNPFLRYYTAVIK